MILSADWPERLGCLLTLYAARRPGVGWASLRRLNCVEGYVGKPLLPQCRELGSHQRPSMGLPVDSVALVSKMGQGDVYVVVRECTHVLLNAGSSTVVPCVGSLQWREQLKKDLLPGRALRPG